VLKKKESIYIFNLTERKGLLEAEGKDFLSGDVELNHKRGKRGEIDDLKTIHRGKKRTPLCHDLRAPSTRKDKKTLSSSI